MNILHSDNNDTFNVLADAFVTLT